MSLVLRLWWRTVRVRMTPENHAIVTRKGQPILYVMWHNRLFMTADFVRRYRGGHPIHGLISASKDGDWLAALFWHLGLGTIRGSSSRRGREAAIVLVDTLKAGHDVGITPDGPRGPVYLMKSGTVVVARRSGARLVLVGMDFESAWRISSWDGFYLPKPFSLVHMRFHVADPDEVEDVEEAARLLGRRLQELNPDRRSAPVRRKASA